jgi:hypothetical protein
MQQHRRLFTLAEAQELLPVVRRLIEELQDGKYDLERASEHFDELLARTGGNGHLQEDLASTRARSEMLAMQLQKLYSELDALGVELKGIDEGLVDFPSQRDGRTVYLCWRLGEDRIEWWHEVDAGFAGRQPL